VRPSIDRVRIQFKVGGQDQAGTLELLAGNVDLASFSPNQASLLKGNPRFEAYFRYQALSSWLIWNFNIPPLSDKLARQALAHATNRRELHRLLGFPKSVPLTDGPFFMCDPQNIQVVAPYTYDPERAQSLLQETGWLDVDGDGALKRDGEPFVFTLLLDQRFLTAAVFVQDQLSRIGVDMKLQVVDQSLVRARFDAGEFDAIIVHKVRSESDVVRADSPLGLLDSELAEALLVARNEPDLDRKLQSWLVAGELYRELAPALFLHPRVSVLVADRRLQGLGEPGTIVGRMSWRHAFGGLEHLSVGEGRAARP
jgi:ABC-type transport system substrate-binding protein